MCTIVYDEMSGKIDWKEKHPDNTENPSCEACGEEEIQYHASLETREGRVHYLICGYCKHVFESSLR